MMFNFVHLIKRDHERLAAIITREQGKTLADSRGDVSRGLQVAEAACAAPELLKGELLEVARYMETKSHREPLGVVAAICPFSKNPLCPQSDGYHPCAQLPLMTFISTLQTSQS